MIGNKKLLSICCVGYNHALYIKDSIGSVCDYKYHNIDIEIIVVDDGSKDNSPEILKNLKESSQIPIILVLQNNTGNVGHNFNVALSKAKGDFILFMSLDDALCLEILETCINKMIDNSNLAFITSSKVVAIDQNGALIVFTL